MRELAMYVPMVTPPAIISLRDLRDHLPLLEPVIQFYGSVSAFVNATPGLFFADSHAISLHPQFHAELRGAAAAAAGRAGGEGAMERHVPGRGHATHGHARGAGW